MSVRLKRVGLSESLHGALSSVCYCHRLFLGLFLKKACGSFQPIALALSPSRHLESQKGGQSADDVPWEFVMRYSEKWLCVFKAVISLHFYTHWRCSCLVLGSDLGKDKGALSLMVFTES